MEAPLTDRGIATATVSLPSCGEVGGALGDLYDDVGSCRRAVAEAEGPVILCGHSYGGVIITEAGADDRVTQLLYVTSVMPDNGESQASSSVRARPMAAARRRRHRRRRSRHDPGVLPPGLRSGDDRAGARPPHRQSITPFTNRPAKSPGVRSPPRTSSAPKTSRSQPRRSVDVSEPAPDSSSSTPATTRSSHTLTSSRRASLRRSEPPARPPLERPPSRAPGRSCWRRCRTGRPCGRATNAH